jgi:hypothetical protein
MPRDAFDILTEFGVTVDVFSRTMGTFVARMRLEGALFREVRLKRSPPHMKRTRMTCCAV